MIFPSMKFSFERNERAMNVRAQCSQLTGELNQKSVTFLLLRIEDPLNLLIKFGKEASHSCYRGVANLIHTMNEEHH
jgi:hypothetical protein